MDSSKEDYWFLALVAMLAPKMVTDYPVAWSLMIICILVMIALIRYRDYLERKSEKLKENVDE